VSGFGENVSSDLRAQIRNDKKYSFASRDVITTDSASRLFRHASNTTYCRQFQRTFHNEVLLECWYRGSKLHHDDHLDGIDDAIAIRSGLHDDLWVVTPLRTESDLCPPHMSPHEPRRCVHCDTFPDHSFDVVLSSPTLAARSPMFV